MDWITYLFRFNGRVNRAKFWFGLLYLFCIMGVLLALGAGLSAWLGGEVSFDLDTGDIFGIVDPATYQLPSLAKLPLVLFKLVATGLLLWIYFALTIKRLHDRDKSAWWTMPFFVLPGLYDQFADRLPDSYWMLPLAVAAFALYFWSFVEMGFLRGNPRTNRFGPNPLGKAQARPRSAAGSASHSDGWDQQAALEFVPHSASPPGGMHVKRGT